MCIMSQYHKEERFEKNENVQMIPINENLYAFYDDSFENLYTTNEWGYFVYKKVTEQTYGELLDFFADYEGFNDVDLEKAINEFVKLNVIRIKL